MKINWHWGTKLLLATIAFMVMVIALGIRMFQERVDLVEEDYYPKGQVHQELINKRNNAIGLDSQINITVDRGILQISFPESFNPSEIQGIVHFYQRTSDQYDKRVKLVVDNSHMFNFPAQALQGRYIVKIDWSYRGVQFYNEKSINLP
jgi:hypothetical protein